VNDAIVEDNEVYENMNHGLQNIGGRDNIWRDNYVHDNWNAGVMLWHPDGIIVQNNVIENNNIYSFNGIGNTEDAHGAVGAVGTSDPDEFEFAFKLISNTISDNGVGVAGQERGVTLRSGLDVHDGYILIKMNVISGHDVDVMVQSETDNTVVTYNNLKSGTTTVVQNDDGATDLDAEGNWWGDNDPSNNVAGTGTVDYTPWASAAYPEY